MRPKVGIVTRTKNRPVLLKRALDSIINQSFGAWNLVVVNDGGDPTPVEQLLQYYAPAAENRIRVIHNRTSHGMEAASNIGVHALDCDYLAIHDDDDTWAPEFLSIIVSELEHARLRFASIGAMLAMANSVYERVDRNSVSVEHTEPYKPWVNKGPLSLDSMLIENQFAPIQVLWRMDAAKDVGLFREDLPVLGDWEFNVRFLLKYDIGVVPQTLAFYHHRLQDGGIYGNSIYAARDRHHTYAQILRNEWLRHDIANGAPGLGTFGSSRLATQHVQWKLEAIEKGKLDAIERRLATLEAASSPPKDKPLSLRREKPKQRRTPARTGQPIRNSGRLMLLWLKSENPIRSAWRGLVYWWKHGYRAAIARLKEWMVSRQA